MNGTRSHRYSRPASSGPIGPGATAAPASYWGWSHQNGRMEMMDLQSYLDSLRQGYDTALQDLYSRASTLSSALGAAPGMYGGVAAYPVAPPAAPAQGRHGRHGRHEGHRNHEHERGPGGHHRHGDDDECDQCEHHCDHCDHCDHGDQCDHCGEDCRCDCCIVDADIVVYARCGEVRIIPIEIENDSRKAREGVTVDASEVRTSGGRVLPWQKQLQPAGSLTLEPCSTTKLELLVHVICGQDPTTVTPAPPADAPKDASTTDVAPNLVRIVGRQRATTGDVDQCEVGYITVRVGGCLVRPIVVAIAVLPDSCGTYRASCSCSCCC